LICDTLDVSVKNYISDETHIIDLNRKHE